MGPLNFHMNSRIPCQFLQKAIWHFDRDCVQSVDNLGEGVKGYCFIKILVNFQSFEKVYYRNFGPCSHCFSEGGYFGAGAPALPFFLMSP